MKWSRRNASQRCQMRAAAQPLSEIMRQRADVSASRDGGAKFGGVASKRRNGEVMNNDTHWRKFDCFSRSRKRICRASFDLLCAVRRRRLQQFAIESSACRFSSSPSSDTGVCGPTGFPFGVVCGGGLTKADAAGVGLLHPAEKLRQARVAPQQQRQHAGRHRVERTQMPDGALAEDAPGTRNHIVRGHARRLVEDQQAVHFPTITAGR